MTTLLFVTGDACMPKKMGEHATRDIKNIPASSDILSDNK
jgi:hypothetical protein